MKTTLLFLLAIYPLPLGEGGVRVQSAEDITPAVQSITQKDLSAHLTFLASEALEGRESTTRGAEVAARYIAAEFTKYGLKPIGDNATYFQVLPLVLYIADNDKSSIALRTKSKTLRYKAGQDFNGSFRREVSFDAPVVFAGYGITAPEYKYDDYAGVDARGKVVAIFDHEPQEGEPGSIFNGIGNSRHASSYLKIINAQKHGALGIFLIAEPKRKHPAGQDNRRGTISSAPVPGKPTPSQAIDDSPSSIPMLTINDEVAVALLEGTGKTLLGLQRQIDSTMKSAAFDIPSVTVSVNLAHSETRRGTTSNVAGMLEGSDPQLKEEFVIMGAHYDHNGIRGGRVYPGADDNGSGTAGMLELAQAFATSPVKPKRTVIFIAFGAEEKGLLGSYYYVEHPLRPLDRTRLLVNYDMIGRNEASNNEYKIPDGADRTNDAKVGGYMFSPGLRNLVDEKNRVIGLSLDDKYMDADFRRNAFYRSDQWPFAMKDVPVLRFATGLHPDYHQTTDMVDKINFPKMERIVRLTFMCAWEVAQGRITPEFNPAP